MIEAVCPASFPPALSCVWTLSVNSILHEEVATDLLLKISQLIISVTDSRSQCPTSPCLTSTSLPVSSHWVAPKDHSLNAPHPISEMPALVPSQKPGSLPEFSLLSTSGGSPSLAKSPPLPISKLSPHRHVSISRNDTAS